VLGLAVGLTKGNTSFLLVLAEKDAQDQLDSYKPTGTMLPGVPDTPRSHYTMTPRSDFDVPILDAAKQGMGSNMQELPADRASKVRSENGLKETTHGWKGA
jgi:hypothetical protein